ncbi:hypothetical protein DMN91_012150 [Ooceraea biroi]|uniref:Uncharacterized protein n=1 Tax=Ooceraea biroi TaxID=2015173 RepID=A0A3L8D4J3_OOCBI|nr:hypothetical protein DMN91_012150 [Ooceraea biroi]
MEVDRFVDDPAPAGVAAPDVPLAAPSAEAGPSGVLGLPLSDACVDLTDLIAFPDDDAMFTCSYASPRSDVSRQSAARKRKAFQTFTGDSDEDRPLDVATPSRDLVARVVEYADRINQIRKKSGKM